MRDAVSIPDVNGKHFPFLPMLIAWAMVSLLLIVTGWANIISGAGWDPDDQLRMVQLRDFLAGQGWFDTAQYRLNPPEGAPMHWSRLIELPLALIILLLAPVIGQPAAEIAAGLIVPLGCLLLVAWMLGRIVLKIAGQQAALAAILMTLTAPPLLLQLRPMRIDHHGWQIVLATLALWTLLWPRQRAAGIVMGAALATWLHISLEGAPMTAAFFGFCGWQWAMREQAGRRLFFGIASFAAVSFALYFATSGSPFSVVAACDVVSTPHLSAIAAATAILLPAIYAAPRFRLLRFGALAVTGAAALAVLLAIAPQCAGGAFASLDPLVRDHWYALVSEGLPIWQQADARTMALAAGLLCALAAAWWVDAQLAGRARRQLRQIMLFVIVSAALTMLVFRTVSVAAAFAIVPMAIAVSALFERYKREDAAHRRIGFVALILFLMLPGAVIGQAFALFDGTDDVKASEAGGAPEIALERCAAPESVMALGDLPKGSRIAAPFNLGPKILLTTPHSVLASSHHRNIAGMRSHILAFRSAPDDARRVLAQHGITHIAVCSDEPEMQNYQRTVPDGLYGQIAAGRAPEWIIPMAPRGDGIRVWRIRQTR